MEEQYDRYRKADIFADFHPILNRNNISDLYINSQLICIKIWERIIFRIFCQIFLGVPFKMLINV